MHVETTIAGARARVADLRAERRRIALVPTMGALHEGHRALVQRAADSGAAVVASIFVNPLQFGPAEDFARYPRTLEADAALLAQSGVALLFAPTTAEMYPAGRSHVTTVHPGPAGDLFEGALRPGHFAGVLTIVAKLLHVVQPDAAVFGEKDLQQVAVVRAMVRDLDMAVEVVTATTVREPDGLALSSRNRYLSPDERQRAPTLVAALRAGAAAAAAGCDPAGIEAAARERLAVEPALALEYLAVVDRDSFRPPERLGPGSALIAAVRLGGTRLIDNVLLVP